MSNYLGQSPVFGDFPFQILTGDGGASYTLTYKVSGENGMLVFLNGAVQRPGIDYTAKGSLLTFSSVVSSGVQIFTYGMGLPKSTLAPSDGASLATPTQFDNSQKIATTEFVQRALGSASDFEELSGNRTLTAADAGKSFYLNALGIVLTFPDSTTLPSGWEVTILSTGSTSCTLAGSSFAGSGGTPVTESAGFSLKIHARKAANIYRVSHWGQGANLMVANGYQRLPSGLIIQWGYSASSNGVTTLPIAFPNVNLMVAATPAFSGASYSGQVKEDPGARTLSSIVIRGYTTSAASTASASHTWLAIGY